LRNQVSNIKTSGYLIIIALLILLGTCSCSDKSTNNPNYDATNGKYYSPTTKSYYDYDYEKAVREGQNEAYGIK